MIAFTDEFGVKDVSVPVEGGIVRPPKIGWRSIHTNIQTINAEFRSEHDYQRFQESLRQAEHKGVRFVTEKPTPALFQKFFAFYREQMLSMPGGRVKLPVEWLQRHAANNEETLGYFAYAGDKLVGGSLSYVNNDEHSIHVGYLASDHAYPGVTSGLHYELLKDVILRKSTRIYYGRDTNLYGIALNPGLAFSKIRFGLEPYLLPDVPIVHSFFLEMPKQLPVMFYAYDEAKKAIYLYVLSETADMSFKQYQSDGIDRIEVHAAAAIVAEHAAPWAKLNAA